MTIAIRPCRLLLLSCCWLSLMSGWTARAFRLLDNSRYYVARKKVAWSQKRLLVPTKSCYMTRSCTRLFSSNSLGVDASDLETAQRRKLIWQSLQELDIDAQALDHATINFIQNPSIGYDGRYGKSAIRTYKSFLYPKQGQPENTMDSVQLNAAASRCARQIQFLLNRHKSHQVCWYDISVC